MGGAGPVRPPRLLVVGELCVDIVVRLDDEVRFGQHEQLVDSTTLTMGSSSAITACGAAALGIPTALVSVRGADVFGDFLDAQLRRRGVDTRFVRVDASAATGASTHLTRTDGDRAILTSMGSIGTVTAAEARPAFDGFSHLHVGSYFLQQALWGQAAALFADAREAGMTTSVDGNFDPSLGWDRGILDLLVHTDVFFGNEQELAGITGIRSADVAVESLLRRMPDGATVVDKRGAAGAAAATLVDGDVAEVTAAAPSVPGALVDTVGAGDSLAAGYLAAMMNGASPERAIAFAVACGTASTRGAGGVAAQPDHPTAQLIAQQVPVTRVIGRQAPTVLDARS